MLSGFNIENLSPEEQEQPAIQLSSQQPQGVWSSLKTMIQNWSKQWFFTLENQNTTSNTASTTSTTTTSTTQTTEDKPPKEQENGEKAEKTSAEKGKQKENKDEDVLDLEDIQDTVKEAIEKKKNHALNTISTLCNLFNINEKRFRFLKNNYAKFAKESSLAEQLDKHDINSDAYFSLDEEEQELIRNYIVAKLDEVDDAPLELAKLIVGFICASNAKKPFENYLIDAKKVAHKKPAEKKDAKINEAYQTQPRTVVVEEESDEDTEIWEVEEQKVEKPQAPIPTENAEKHAMRLKRLLGYELNVAPHQLESYLNVLTGYPASKRDEYIANYALSLKKTNKQPSVNDFAEFIRQQQPALTVQFTRKRKADAEHLEAPSAKIAKTEVKTSTPSKLQ